MKWRPISEIANDADVLFRIELPNEILFVVGNIYNGGLFIQDTMITFLDFSGGYLCDVDKLHERNIKSIYRPERDRIMKWKNIEQYNLPDHYNCFWRYEFDDGDIRYFCHEIQMTRLDMKTRRMGWLKAVYFIDPKDIPL